jgi:ATP phosphoribosyltransferase regulatory subunit
MTKNRRTPEGTGDMLFEECEAEKKVIERLEQIFEDAGYRQVRTPGVEFLNIFSQSKSLSNENMYKFTDYKGRLLALRPDSTIPIARMTSTRLKGHELPIKMYYAQSVYRQQEEHKGRSSEMMQMGVELIGESSFESDVDMIALAIASLEATYPGSKRIEIGHVGFYNLLMDKLDADDEDRERVHRYVTSKNYAALDEITSKFDDERTADILNKLPRLFGGEEALAEAAELFSGYDDRASEMVGYLSNVIGELARRGFADKVVIDLGLVNAAEYYSSLVFRGYGESAGEPLLSGGRYDNLFSDFGEDLPATGFGINVDLLYEAELAAKLAVSSDKAGGVVPRTGKLRIALTKGRLEKDFVRFMEAAGYDMTPLLEKGRKLLIEIPSAGVEIFLAKAPDVITYVEHGVCEIGIVGKDTIIEHGGTYYEIMDLGVGKCRFALATPGGRDFFDGYGSKVVASKYPNFTSRYFESKGMDVEIIKIEGSVEIAPLLGVADGIVDLVETGTTLAENGLEVIEYIRDISARLIVNVTGMKLMKKEIDAFAESLQKVI